jgi:hypothetical protein
MLFYDVHNGAVVVATASYRTKQRSSSSSSSSNSSSSSSSFEMPCIHLIITVLVCHLHAYTA